MASKQKFQRNLQPHLPIFAISFGNKNTYISIHQRSRKRTNTPKLLFTFLTERGPREQTVEFHLKITKAIEDYLGPAEVAIGYKTVLTIHCGAFNNAQERQHFSDRDAQLENSDSVSESLAAAISYGVHKQKGLYAILDLGFQSLDFTLYDGKNHAIKGIESRIDLGGEDFDTVIVDYVKQEVETTDNLELLSVAIKRERERVMARSEGRILTDIDLHIQLVKESLPRLKEMEITYVNDGKMLNEAAENAKIALSTSDATIIRVPIISNALPDVSSHKHFHFTRAHFEWLAAHLIYKIKEFCLENLFKAGLTANDIDAVILVGGMANVPMVESVITEVFGKAPMMNGVDKKHAVVLGAAVAEEEGCLGILESPTQEEAEGSSLLVCLQNMNL